MRAALACTACIVCMACMANRARAASSHCHSRDPLTCDGLGGGFWMRVSGLGGCGGGRGGNRGCNGAAVQCKSRSRGLWYSGRMQLCGTAAGEMEWSWRGGEGKLLEPLTGARARSSSVVAECGHHRSPGVHPRWTRTAGTSH
jgi:hypothetical protein